VSSLVPRIATLVVAVLIGTVYGTAATVGHAFTLGWFPLGLILAIIGSGGLLLALRLLTGDRWTALAGGLGIVLATFVFSQQGPGGSAIVAAPSPGTEWIPLVWTGAVPLMVAVVVAWPDLSKMSSPARPVGEIAQESPRRLGE
jgi:hypothetical protein